MAKIFFALHSMLEKLYIYCEIQIRIEKKPRDESL